MVGGINGYKVACLSLSLETYGRYSERRAGLFFLFFLLKVVESKLLCFRPLDFAAASSDEAQIVCVKFHAKIR